MAGSQNTNELPKAYEPTDVEEKWQRRWIDGKCFSGNPASDKDAYSIVIPPPNVTGMLHLGHVLNNTIQDILARRARQQGKEVMWLPGCDHAGIATQVRVEKELRKTEGKTRHDLGRDAFLEKVWEWKEDHGGIIFKQLRRLGCSLDWERERFTLDEDYTEWVLHVFVQLFKEGFIYRGKRMVNWCPISLTALSDEEVIMKPQRSKLYTMRYEIVDRPGEFFLIATTRPETLMGDVAVAVHPNDERYKDLIGKKVRRPFPAAEIPIIADEHVEMEFGTGALKITPAHDPADFEIGQRHDLEAIDVLTPDGKVNCPECPELHGLDRFAARKKAAEMLEEMGLIEKIEDYENNVGFSERADVPVEPRLSMQWFLKYPAVDDAAAAVANDEITFRPARWKKTYAHWMENLQDWCISRQLWWGHRIPVWYRKEKAFELREAASLDVANLEAGDLHVGTEPPADAENWEQDADVLDTWFSSWLWPFATMTKVGEKSDTLKKFYPTTDLVTGPDIIFFWVARMIMAGFHFEGQKPFNNVFFTSIIRDIKGRKMSKSLGNSPDPLDLMAEYGADGLRFGLMRIAPTGTDVKFDESQIGEGRNFANKLYNAVRFRLMQGNAGTSSDLDITELELTDVHIDILAKLDQLAIDLENAYADYQFNTVTQVLYQFFWNEYCDWFVEASKGSLREEEGSAARTATLWVIDTVLERFLAHLHPFMPHITEELWETLGFAGDSGLPLMQTPINTTPVLAKLDAAAVATAKATATALYETVGRARNLKAEYNLASNKNVRFVLAPAGDAPSQATLDTLQLLAGSKAVDVDPNFDAPKGTPSAITPLGALTMPLEGLIDLDAERSRLTKEIGKVEGELKKSRGKLSNPSFAERAPEAVVNTERERLKEWESKLAQLQEMLAALG
ncbi:valine--tRNA ligase [Sulfuriroseicoccus oceanibius]|uniref:Valine--tRNA ligase n=1 Tax=Sulfuriroseicoccus oceanibius TaxID=2707525 RepID=A0A6B3L9B8_9BACT|nr:valine--tRNA ligase [Sulfuriroseicoccus oceanibius]QQL45054.1 valine--tRNA ligase [Sulfuriroseicoccus oceanibius]